MVLVGVKVTVVGLLVVFFGLVVLIACISAMHAIMSRKTEKPAAAPVAAPAAVPAAPRTYVPGPELKDKSPELYAVITAAVSEEMRKKGVNPEGGFKIKSIKRK